MKVFRPLVLASVLFVGMCVTGCETSHTESDKPGWFGGNTHKETTVRENPVTGDTSVKHTETKTN